MLALRTFVLSAALLALLAATAPAAPAKKKQTPAERMIAKVNKVRDNHGLRPLRTAPKLMRSSRGYARHLIRTNTFGHGSSYAQAGFRSSGEILALTRGWRRKPHPALGMWLRSSGHRALILSPTFRYIGVAPARGRFGGPRTTIWVAHFGAR
jgi:uncharacterized protein YkwD